MMPVRNSEYHEAHADRDYRMGEDEQIVEIGQSDYQYYEIDDEVAGNEPEDYLYQVRIKVLGHGGKEYDGRRGQEHQTEVFHQSYYGRVPGHEEHYVSARMRVQRKYYRKSSERHRLYHLGGALILEEAESDQHQTEEQA